LASRHHPRERPDNPAGTAPWGPHTATADAPPCPQAVFCDPPVAAAGLTAEQAGRAGHHSRVVNVGPGQTVMGANLNADGRKVHARMVVDQDHGCLLGVTLVGSGVGELLRSATAAVAAQVPIARLPHAAPCFPLISEIWLRFPEAYRW
jgi:pyruvate/2-oxoglutarate dehydrogenase complex dihydrolipoamide dehydrogenase (E3) component